MHNIDFLPAEYRQRHARRRLLVWRNAITAMTCIVVAVAAVWQQHVRSNLASQLQAATPQYELARRETSELNKLQAQLRDAQTEAELVAYLRHPWPRTQLLAELLRPLPDEITFTVLNIGLLQPAGAPRPGQILPTEKRPEDLPSHLSASEDLKKLREERDRAQTVITLEGVTTDSDALHRYLGQLNDSALFTNAELESLDVEQNVDKPRRLRFVATLQVEPAYGIPGGPTGPPASAVANGTQPSRITP